VKKLVVLDYGGGNLKSVTNILDKLGEDYILSDNKNDLINADKIILPGQGHFGQVMESLNSRDLTKTIIKKINSGTPFLGICVGIQILFDESEEAPDIQGLGVFPGKVIKFTQGKVPQIGWNELKITENNSILSNDYVYFVNSYYVVPHDPKIVSAYANYHIDFAASVEYDNIVAFQFHPEKSGESGTEFFKRWLTRFKNS